MKKILFTAVAALCLLTAGRGFAQDRHHALQAQIPFDFCVGNATLPAGDYLLGQLPRSSCTLVVRNRATGEAILNIANFGPEERSDHPGMLLFNRYGDQYFLSQIHMSNASLDVSLPVSSRERSAQEELSQVKVYEHITVPTEKD